MQRATRFFPVFIFAFALGSATVAPTDEGLALSLLDRTKLQAAMQRHVDRQTIDGVYPYLDTESGDVKILHPVTGHPIILRMGNKFVLCYDFVDQRNRKAEIDYYLAAKGDSYVVFHTAINNRALLMRLMSAGKVTRAD